MTENEQVAVAIGREARCAGAFGVIKNLTRTAAQFCAGLIGIAEADQARAAAELERGESAASHSYLWARQCVEIVGDRSASVVSLIASSTLCLNEDTFSSQKQLRSTSRALSTRRPASSLSMLSGPKVTGQC